MTWTLAGILLYVLIQILIGAYVSRSVKTEEDYLLAGRRLGLTFGTFTVFATWFGAESVIGSSGAVYDGGMSAGSADPFGFGLCLLLMGAVYAVPLWKRKLTTLADLFRDRYSTGVERIAVLFMAPSTLMWAAAQIRAFGQVLSASAGVDISAAILLAGCIVILYTVLGGLMAVAATDFLQGMVLITGLVLLVVFVVLNEPGLGAAWAQVDASRLTLRQPPGTPLLESINAWVVPICGSVVAQELVARVIAAKSPDTARKSALAGGTLYIVMGLIPVGVGLVGLHLFPGLAESEAIIPAMAETYLPTFVYIVFIGALVSAILSTVDSALLVVSSLVSHNIVVPMLKDAGEGRKILSARVFVVVFGLLAMLIALRADGVYDLVVDAASFGTAGVFTLVTFALFTRIGTARSAYAALFASMGLWIIGNYVMELPWAYLLSLCGAVASFLIAAIRFPGGGFKGLRPAVDRHAGPFAQADFANARTPAMSTIRSNSSVFLVKGASLSEPGPSAASST